MSERLQHQLSVSGFFVLFLGVTNLATKLAFSSIIYTSITFFMFLLVFVSIKRLVAVKHPHSFSMEPQRAKKYNYNYHCCGCSDKQNNNEPSF